MVLGVPSTANRSCTTRANLCVRTEISRTFLQYLLTRLQGNIVVARELARRYGDKIVSTSLHPGSIRTDLWRHFPGWVLGLFVCPPLRLVW
jgi:hypothetical protein